LIKHRLHHQGLHQKGKKEAKKNAKKGNPHKELAKKVSKGKKAKTDNLE